MNFSQIVTFIYSLVNTGVKIWVSDKKIKLFVPNTANLSDSQREFIELYKNEILHCLHKNNIVSENYDFIILKSDLTDGDLSYAQERLWFIEKYEEGTNAYNISMLFKLSGTTNLDFLEKSIKKIINRHEILRTVIREDNDYNCYQHTLDDKELPFHIEKIRIKDYEELEEALSKEVNHIYDLSNEYPLRASVYKLINHSNLEESYKEYYLSLIVHHIAFDGWSIDIFLRELQEYYKYYLKLLDGIKEPRNLSELRFQYKDFAVWQRSYLSGERFEKQVNYWKNKLIGYENLNLIPDQIRPEKINYQGSNIFFNIDKKTSIDLRELAKKLNISLYSLLLSAYYLMLRAYSNQNDIVIGSPIANRHYSQVENLIGFFANVLALRTIINPEVSIKEYIQKVGADVVEAQLHQDLPFEKLVEELNLPKDMSRHPIFQVMFGLESFGASHNLIAEQEQNDQSLFLEPYTLKKIGSEAAKFDLSLFIDDRNIELTGNFNYAESLYKKESIEGYIETYTHILKQLSSIANNPEKQTKIRNLEYLNADRYYQLIHNWNKTEKKYPENKTIQELFEEQVEKTPNNVAIVHEGKKLKYQELNERANQLAHYIKNNYDITPDTLIVLCLDRNEYILVAILAILKAGGAYIPIDPNYPDERVKYILEDTKTKLVLTSEVYSQRLKSIIKKSNSIHVKINKETKIIEVDNKELQNHLSLQLETNLKLSTTSTNLAYVIYTSGTAGNPKGVMIEHRGVINTVLSLNNVYNFKKGNKVAGFTSYVFDVSVSEFFTVLLRGGELFLLNKKTRDDPVLISKFIIENNINYLYLPPALLPYFPRVKHETLQGIIYAGEPCDKEVGKYWSNNCKLYNYYGPTEATIYASGKQVIDGDVNLIGSPISNTKCYVLDAHLTPLPIRAVGELYLGGVGLSRGYLNNPQMTMERFIINPFQTEEEKKLNQNPCLYKTGDLVRWLPGKNLEYIGRNDCQVKIRGYRVALGEIESVLSSYEGIEQGIVLVKEHTDENGILTGNKYLVGYYTSHQQKLDEDGILAYLRTKLPEYMIPNNIVYLETFPLTINGKLDRNTLPAPELILRGDHLDPRNEIESQLCYVWGDVLGLNPSTIGINNNFFDLGGNSILILKLKSKIEKKLKIKDLKVSDLFKYSTINDFGNFLLKEKNNYTDNYYLSKPKYFGSSQEIAVISMSCAFPGSANVEEYWENIIKGKECLTRLSKDIYRERRVPEFIFNDENFIPIGGEIKGIEEFDYRFWNISFKDAVLIDPQIRKFLEHCWDALEQSGDIRLRREKKIGVFAGMSNSRYFETRIQNNQKLLSQITSWEVQNMNDKDFLATRISYLLGLTGPSLNINTACSTSLVAIVEACKNLAMGTCDMALAGGVSFSMPENHGYMYKDGLVFSKDGHCRAFDSNSSGTTVGNGVGVVVLKRLQEAINDKSNIIAIVKGYATNNDGDRKVGYVAPSVKGQTECILEAQNIAQVTSDTISYVECHGTGTSLGDAIEVAALHEAFTLNSKGDKYQCILGSIKANIGHADSASGIAGFIKTCKMLQNKLIPPQINFSSPNKDLNLEKTHFNFNVNASDWIKNYYPRRAGVSSFGIGGTNAHIVLEEYTKEKDELERNILDKFYVLPISAKSKLSCDQYCKSLEAYLCLNSDISLVDVAFTLQKREYFDYRYAVVCKNKEEAICQLKSIQCSSNLNRLDSAIIFMFPGQGAQYANMAKNLYETETIFKNYIDQCCEIIFQVTNLNFKDYLYPILNDQSDIFLKETKWAQPALFVVSYSLAKLLESLEINATAYIGHSIGEYVAATLSGVFNLESALKIIIKRGELMQKMPKGGMLMINASMVKIQSLLPQTLEISVYNAPEYNVVSGQEDEIEAFKIILDSVDIPYSRLQTSHAFHSYMMKEAANEFEQYLKGFKFNKPSKVFVSNVTGELITEIQARSPQYWATHIMMPVQFCQGVATLNSKYKNAIYVEVGPGKGLSIFINEFKNDGKLNLNNINMLPSHKEYSASIINDVEQFYTAISKLWNFGYKVDWFKSWKTDLNLLKIVDLPTYQFEKNKCWIDLPQINSPSEENEWFYQPSWKRISKLTNLQNIKLDQKQCWLIFRDKNGRLDSLINTLNATNQNIIVVNFSDSNKEIEILKEKKIIINPYNESHYMDLANYLKTNNFNISYFIHGWTITDLEDALNQELAQYLGFYSLHLVQSILCASLGENIKFLVISNGLNQVLGCDPIHIHKGTILGAARVIPHETHKIKMFIVDIGFDETHQMGNLLSLILTESNYFLEPNFSIRSNYLWKEEVEPVYINKGASSPLVNNNDVILITGGLGGIGLAIAKKISNHHKVKFILLSRGDISSPKNDSSPTSEKYYQFQIKSLDLIKKNGCEVDIYKCDIRDFTNLDKLVQIIQEKHKKIDGIIHAAGDLPLSIAERNLNHIKIAIGAKILGAINLYTIFEEKPLKFFIMMSSLASLMGDVGRFEYCAANSFLDTLSNIETNNIKNLMSINWPGWSDIGMSIKFNNTSETLESESLKNYDILDLNIITEEQGVEIFYRLLNQTQYKQIAISKFNISNLKKEFFEKLNTLEIINDKNIDLDEILIEKNSTEIEMKLSKIFFQILGTKRLSKYDNYFELGGNSLSAIRMMQEINKGLEVSLTLPIIYKQNTISKLAQYIINSYKNENASVYSIIDEGEF